VVDVMGLMRVANLSQVTPSHEEIFAALCSLPDNEDNSDNGSSSTQTPTLSFSQFLRWDPVVSAQRKGAAETPNCTLLPLWLEAGEMATTTVSPTSAGAAVSAAEIDEKGTTTNPLIDIFGQDEGGGQDSGSDDVQGQLLPLQPPRLGIGGFVELLSLLRKFKLRPTGANEYDDDDGDNGGGDGDGDDDEALAAAVPLDKANEALDFVHSLRKRVGRSSPSSSSSSSSSLSLSSSTSGLAGEADSQGVGGSVTEGSSEAAAQASTPTSTVLLSTAARGAPQLLTMSVGEALGFAERVQKMERRAGRAQSAHIRLSCVDVGGPMSNDDETAAGQEEEEEEEAAPSSPSSSELADLQATLLSAIGTVRTEQEAQASRHLQTDEQLEAATHELTALRKQLAQVEAQAADAEGRVNRRAQDTEAEQKQQRGLFLAEAKGAGAAARLAAGAAAEAAAAATAVATAAEAAAEKSEATASEGQEEDDEGFVTQFMNTVGSLFNGFG